MRVDASDNRVGKSGAVDISLEQSAIGFELGIELFKRTCIELVQRDMSKLGNNLLVDALLVCGLGRFF